MLATQRREGGGEEEGDNHLWDGLELLEKAYASGSFGRLQQMTKNSTTNNVPTASDEEFPPTKMNNVQSVTSRNEQQLPALQERVTTSKLTHQDALSWYAKPSGSLQHRRQETGCQSRLASPSPTGTEPPRELACTQEKAEEDNQERLGAVQGQAKLLVNHKDIQTRSDNLNDSAVHSPTTGSLRSFGRRKPQPWPNPQHSLGDRIQTNNKKIKGKVWVAVGPALELFEAQIRPQIERLLHNTEPPQCSPLLLTIYMIGKSEMKASPIIMICCCDREVRKEAEATIRKSDILQQYPQMGLGNSATLLETDSLVVAVTGRPNEGQVDFSSFSGIEEEHIIGRRLRLSWGAEGNETVRVATGGPFVWIDKHVYQLTAFHCGQRDAGTGPVAQLDSDSDECEYDGQSDTEEDESDFEEETAEGNPFNELSSTLDNKITSISMASKPNTFLEEDDRQDCWSPETVFNCRNIDYDLVRLPAAEASKASNETGMFENRHSIRVTDIGAIPTSRTAVVVVTSYALLTGTILPGIKRVKMQGFYGFQNLGIARLSRSVETGDSGSAVFDASTGCFYGHVVLGSAPDTLVYIVPSVNIFTSVVALFGRLPSLNLDGPILNARGVMHQTEKRSSAAPDPEISDSNHSRKQHLWSDHSTTVTDREGQVGSIAGQTQVTRYPLE